MSSWSLVRKDSDRGVYIGNNTKEGGMWSSALFSL